MNQEPSDDARPRAHYEGEAEADRLAAIMADLDEIREEMRGEGRGAAAVTTEASSPSERKVVAPASDTALARVGCLARRHREADRAEGVS